MFSEMILKGHKINLKSEAHGHNAEWLTWVNSYKSLNQHFSLSSAMVKNQNKEFAKNSLTLVEDYSTNTSEKVLSAYLKWFAKNVTFSILPLNVHGKVKLSLQWKYKSNKKTHFL